MKHSIVRTTRLEEGPDRRIILRETATGLMTLEIDIDTLKELGLPVTVGGSRWLGNVRASVENGPTWDQSGRIKTKRHQDFYTKEKA